MEFRVLVEGERTVGDLSIQIPRVPDSPRVCYGRHKYHSAVCASGCSVQHSGEELQGQQEWTEVVDLRDEEGRNEGGGAREQTTHWAQYLKHSLVIVTSDGCEERRKSAISIHKVVTLYNKVVQQRATNC